MESAAPIIAFDAMGADKGPNEMVAGLALALKEFKLQAEILVVGHSEALSKELRAFGLLEHPRVRCIPAADIISMEDKPAQGLRKRDSSMMRSLDLIKEGKAQGVLSCGNTACLMAGGTIKLRPMPGLERPALATIWPSKDRHFVLLDAGANPETRPEHFLHNAILGKNYARIVLGIDTPRIGLLTIGTEEGKGTENILQAHEYIKSAGPVLNYQGLIEGFQVFSNTCDVIVCDGFTGNILLKVCQSLFGVLKDYLKEELNKNWMRKLGALLSYGAFRAMKKQLNPEHYGGAPLLGLNGYVFKAHGSSNRHHIANALVIAEKVIRCQTNHQIGVDLALLKGQGELAPLGSPPGKAL